MNLNSALRTGASVSTIALILCLTIGTLVLESAGAKPLPAPAGWWKFSEGKGTTVADSSSAGNSATLQPGATWAPGKADPFCISLSGSDTGFADIPIPVVDTTKSYTVMAWVKFAQLGGFQTFVSIDGEQVSGFYLQLRGDSQKLAIGVLPGDAGDPNTPAIAQSNDVPQTGWWYHVAGVYDATAKTVALYVDGSLQQTTPCTAVWKAYGHTLIGRAKYNGSPVDFTNGSIDDVRLYAAALSASDIGEIAKVGAATP